KRVFLVILFTSFSGSLVSRIPGAVQVYCYQLATLIQQPTKSDTTADQHQLQALRERVMALLTTLAVADDIKLVDWLQQRLGLLEQRDTAMLHRLLHDIEKNITK
ncbi:hypothetical protein PO635_23600, partial [Escherichia coli]